GVGALVLGHATLWVVVRRVDQEGTVAGDLEIGVRVSQVTDNRLDLMLRKATRLRLAPGQAQDPMSRAPQRRRDGEPDVPRGSRDEDLHSRRTVADAPGFPRVRTIVHARDPLEALLNPSRLALALLEALLGIGEVRADPLERGPEPRELLAAGLGAGHGGLPPARLARKLRSYGGQTVAQPGGRIDAFPGAERVQHLVMGGREDLSQ